MATRRADGGPNTVDGIHPVIGVLLMLLITLVLAATIGTFFVG